MYEQQIAQLQTNLSHAQSQGLGLREKEAELRRALKVLEQRDAEIAEALQRIEVRIFLGVRKNRKTQAQFVRRIFVK